MAEEMKKWILTHDSHELKKGDVYEGTTLPAWLAGKATPVSADAFEVATPGAADVKKLKAEITALTKRAETAEASLTDTTAKLEAETKRADAAEAALAAATKKDS
ncbi:hypothetical protein [Pantoea sp.]|uniref:hypothetical protein n=1 Tax=Pantoea sp. TaxID=69393 RepID=UPI0028AFE5C7|nr:hypothetical protein [Pantoea sp.]